jgi:hypothetical protein
MFDSAEIAFSLMGIRQYGADIELHLAGTQINSGINVLFSYSLSLSLYLKVAMPLCARWSFNAPVIAQLLPSFWQFMCESINEKILC